jgi:hypothetical protein
MNWSLLRFILFIFSLCSFAGAYAQSSQEEFKEFKTFQVQDAQGLENELVFSSAPVGSFGPVYSTILNELQDQYQIIGERQAQQVIDQRNGFYIGGLNNVGYTFKKGFAYFDINIQRQIAPDLFDDHRYIVTDQFELVIDASKLFSSLDDKGLISISNEQLAAYAGVLFKRTYRYTHFADDYEQALIIDLHKLFMAFTYTRDRSYLDLADYEILQREDFLSVNVGGVFVAPITTGVGIQAGAMAKFEKVFKLEVQGVGPEDQAFQGEALRLSYEKSKGKKIGISAALQIEFLKFLRLTLLSYDFQYEYEESQKTHLSLSSEDVLKLKTGQASETVLSLDRMMMGRNFNAQVLSPYEVGHERRIRERKSSRYMALIYGGLRDQETEHIQIGEEGKWTTFFRHHYESVKYHQNIWSRLVSVLFRSFLQVDSVINHRYSDTKKLRIEYKSEKNLLNTRSNITLSDSNKTEDLSLNFERIIFAEDTKKKKTMRKVLRLLDHFSGADPLAPEMLRQGLLKAPLKLRSSYTIKEEGIRHFNELGTNKITNIIEDMCKVHSSSFWQKLRNLFGGCRYKVNKAFDYYWAEFAHKKYTSRLYRYCQLRNRRRYPERRKNFYIQKCIRKRTYKTPKERSDIPLWRLSDFSQKVHRYSENKLDMISFFGLKNVFLHGSFNAESSNGPFLTHFNEGAFSGLGVVDQHMRRENLRSPASVNLE